MFALLFQDKKKLIKVNAKTKQVFLPHSVYNKMKYFPEPHRPVYCATSLFTHCLPIQGWPGWVDLGGWLHNEVVYLPNNNNNNDNNTTHFYPAIT